MKFLGGNCADSAITGIRCSFCPIRQPEAGEHHAGEADAEFLQRRAARDRLGQALGEFIELVAHTFPFRQKQQVDHMWWARTFIVGRLRDDNAFHRPVSQATQSGRKFGGDFHRSCASGLSESPGPADKGHVVGKIGEQRIGRVECGGALDIELQAVCSVRGGKRPRAGANDSDGLTSAGGQVDNPFPVEMTIAHNGNLRHSINGVAKDTRVGSGNQGKCVSCGDPNGYGVRGRSSVCTNGEVADDKGGKGCTCECESEGSSPVVFFHKSFHFGLLFLFYFLQRDWQISAMPARPRPKDLNACRRVTGWARLLIGSSN
jgi:hypothetical protein